MTAKVRLSTYEQGIAESLVRDYGYTTDSARQTVVAYVGVVRKLGKYDNCEVYAERFDRAMKNGYTSEAWLERIHQLELENREERRLERAGKYAQTR